MVDLEFVRQALRSEVLRGGGAEGVLAEGADDGVRELRAAENLDSTQGGGVGGTLYTVDNNLEACPTLHWERGPGQSRGTR